MSGRYAGIVTPSNAFLCGNKSSWWGFVGQENVDGLLRDLAGPSLADECDALPILTAGAMEKLLPSAVHATGAHGLNARHILHAHAPTSAYPRKPAELALRRTYLRCLQCAHDLEIESLALPALGCGVAGFPAARGARAAYDAIEDAASLGLWSVAEGEIADGPSVDAAATTTSARPPRIEFVLLDERVYAAFADAAHCRWGRTGRP